MFAVLVARSYPALGKLPSDPGYDFVTEMKSRGLAAFVAASEKYLQIAPRIFASVVLLFPIELHAVILQLLQLLTMAGIGTLIFFALKAEFDSTALAATSAIVFVTIPSASESTIGNAGSLKWPLLVLIAVLGVTTQFVDRYIRLCAAVFLIVTLSSPLAAITFPPVLWHYWSQHDLRTHRRILIYAMLLGSGTQVVAWLVRNRNIRIYGDAGQMWPWPGMGVYWYLIWLGPLVVGVCVGICAAMSRSRLATEDRVVLAAGCWLAVEAVALSGLVWVSAGIKDSAAVATQSMAWIAAVLAAYSFLASTRTRLLIRTLSVSAFLLMAILAIKWFPASNYLSGGETWANSIARARNECSAQGRQQAEIKLHLATVEISCLDLD